VRRFTFLALVLLGLMVFAGATAFGQAKNLAITTNKTVVDGVVNPAEYGWSQDFGKLSLYVNRTADTLYIGVVGATTGWVAVGLGSMKMNGSTIFMGFVAQDGKVQFKPQAGFGHAHKDADQAVADTVVSDAMKEVGGKTTLEIALKPATYIKAGQEALLVIYADGPEDSFTPLHMFRGALSIPLAQ
jgi:hypothetical protein